MAEKLLRRAAEEATFYGEVHDNIVQEAWSLGLSSQFDIEEFAMDVSRKMENARLIIKFGDER